MFEPTRSARGRRLAWGAWACGALAFPLGATLVPRDGNAIAIANFLPGARGVEVWLVRALGIALMFAAMLRLRDVPVRAVLVAQLVASVIVAVTTFATPSTDPYGYFMYGRWVATGANPWRPPRVLGDDPVARIARPIVHDPPIRSPYGPAFVGLESMLVRVVPDTSFATWVAIHRALALAAACAISALLRGPRAAFWGLNPLVMLSFAVAGHNDALMLFCIAAAMRARSAVVAGIALGVAATIKLPALASLGVVRRSWPVLGGAVLAAVVVYARFPDALSLSAFVTQVGQDANSPAHALERLFAVRHLPFARPLALAAVVVAIVLLAPRVRRPSRRNVAPALALVLLAIAPYVQSWYFTWPLLGAAWSSRGLRIVILVASGLAWILDFGTISTVPLHASTATFWIAIAASVLFAYRPGAARGAASPTAGNKVS